MDYFYFLSIFSNIFVLRTFQHKTSTKYYFYANVVKFSFLGNNTLDEIAIDLFKGDLDNLKKFRKIKKYFDNKLFSTFMLVNAIIKKRYRPSKNIYRSWKHYQKQICYKSKSSNSFEENNIKEAGIVRIF